MMWIVLAATWVVVTLIWLAFWRTQQWQWKAFLEHRQYAENHILVLNAHRRIMADRIEWFETRHHLKREALVHTQPEDTVPSGWEKSKD